MNEEGKTQLKYGTLGSLNPDETELATVPLVSGVQLNTWPYKILELIKTNAVIFTWVVLSIIAGVAQTVTLKQSGNAMPNFPYFIFWFTALLFVFCFALLLICVEVFTKQITPEMRRFPHYKYAIIGVLTTLNGVFILFPNPYVPGSMQALIGPTITTIPLSMAFTWLLMKRTYGWGQILSVGIIISGIVVAILPSLLGGVQGGSVAWDLLFMINVIPSALSTVYEEKYFHDSPVHMASMLAWSTVYQFLSIIILLPVAGIPWFSSSNYQDMLVKQYYGIECVFFKKKSSWKYMPAMHL